MSRQAALARELEEVSSRIRTLVASIATHEAAHLAFGIFQLGPSEAMEQLGLSSPVAQMRHFLGHVLMTRGPDKESDFSDEQRMQLFELLGRASDLYPFLFVPRPEEFESLDQEGRLRYATAGPAFISHFFQGSLSTTDQVLNRLEAYFTPFDNQLRDRLHLSASQALEITKWLGQRLTLRLDGAKRQVRFMYDVWKSAMEQGWTAERSRAEARRMGLEEIDPLRVERTWIVQEFGTTQCDAYWELLVGNRGRTGGPDFTFFTEPTPFDRHPLLGETDSLAYCPSYHSICLSLFAIFEETIKNEESVYSRFRRHRDALLEKQTADLLRDFCGAEAGVYESVCETSNGQFEHDVVIRYRDTVVVVEAKASPLVEPFRDAAKSFERLKHRFSGERGIQKAYDQAMRVVRRLNDGEDIQLFDQNGQPVLTLSASEISSAIPVCVTADSWGIFATDVSLLLEKQADDPWPWAVWIFDLEIFLEALQLQEQGPDAFLSFLQQRMDLQGRLGTSDELEICGMYVKHGQLPRVSKGALLQPIPEYADIFDEIYFWKQGLRDQPDLSISPEMVHADTTQLARMGAMAMARAAVALDGVPKRVGRNDPCPCGSGRKFKRCHGSPTGHP